MPPNPIVRQCEELIGPAIRQSNRESLFATKGAAAARYVKSSCGQKMQQ